MKPVKKELEGGNEEELETEELEEREVELEGETEVELDDDGNPVKEETPFWLQEEGEQESSKQVPEAAIISIKKKLKGQLREQGSEIERLTQEIERLKQGQAKAVTKPELPKRPRITDFEDDDSYEQAMDEYEAAKIEYQSNTISTTQAQKQQIAARLQKLEEDIDGHYDRAAKLIEKSGINPDVYQQADVTVKKAIDSILPKAGETVFKEFVSLMGEGSEKTMFYIGRNKAALNEFSSLLTNDKSGLSAAYHLGTLNAKISGTQQNKTSRAPKPATQIAGDASATAKSGAFKKKYEEAHKKGNTQAAYNIKKEARSAGIDTSKWS